MTSGPGSSGPIAPGRTASTNHPTTVTAGNVAEDIWKVLKNPPANDKAKLDLLREKLAPLVNGGQPIPRDIECAKFIDLFIKAFQSGGNPFLKIFSHYLGSEADTCWQLVTLSY